ncbi:flagellar basal body-associated protein FliL [Idiomarina seosinensis]|uniref:Flagellar protein FliL n=1 Tax=Idiomarina seosinensis TaxID=281739 RepID=A0A432ZC03_9GAMM|nr:flagellar basal body-associated protein FliL [Idiomarina seosinensis]RUO75468.1 flagellar basal body-associated protein FliL [Idiomarina seosinensis]
MAEENDQEQQDKPTGKRKKLLFIGGGAAIIIIAVVVIWLFSGSSESGQGQSNGGQASQVSADSSDAPEVGNALYVGMPRPFVFIVPGDARERTVQIKVQLMVRGEESEEQVKRHIPLIEGTLHEVFSSSTAEELKTVEGKTKLRELALQEVRNALESVAGPGLVEQVLFTSMVMQ